MHRLHTIGHSTHPLKEFIDILQTYDITHLVDVGTIPKSRYVPWFNSLALKAALAKKKIAGKWRSSLLQHNMLQPTKDICSSLIAEAFQSVKFPILLVVVKEAQKRYELIRRNPFLYMPKLKYQNLQNKIIDVRLFVLISYS